jgi:hypothetical protein
VSDRAAALLGPLGGDAPFLGRADELALLQRHWHAVVADGRRRAVLVAGEAGMGKTRLAAELARGVADAGGTVLYGWSDQHLGVPYQPFIEALHDRLAASSLAELQSLVGPGALQLIRLVPSLAHRVDGSPPIRQVEPEAQRFLLFEALVDYVDSLAAAAPVLLVLDDLHWAAKPTVLLLRHLLRASRFAPVLVLGAYRDTDLDPGGSLADLLAEARIDQQIERLELRGLDVASVRELVPEPSLAAQLHHGSGGNPFLLHELLRDLEARGQAVNKGGLWSATVEAADLGMPAGANEVLGQRIAGLSAETRRVLGVAAVVGPTFTAAVLAGAMTDVDASAIDDALDEAARHGIVDEQGDSYGFHHALVRQLLYTELGPTRRVRLHRQVAEAIEAGAAVGVDDGTVQALAHHFSEAALDGQVTKAADFGLVAARRAMEGLAFEAAVTAGERALVAIGLDSSPDLVRRAAVELVLAEAHQAVGDIAASQAAAEAAAADARALGDATTLARAAILHVELTVVGSPDPVGAALCEEALAALPAGPDPLRVRVAAALAFHRAWSESRGAAVADDAAGVVELARASGDDDALAGALHAQAISLAASTRVDEQLAVIDELLEIGERRSHGHRREQALQIRASTRLRVGDLAGFDADCAELERLGNEHRSWNALAYTAQWRTTRALLDGRFAEVPELADRVLVHGSRYIDYQSVYTSQLFLLATEQGEFAGLRDLLLDAQARTPGVIAFTTALALVHAELGEHREAHDLLDELAPDRFALVPRDVAWFGSLHGICEAAATIGAAEHAGVLYDLLAPEAGRFVVIALGLGCTGSADRYLGALALAAGRVEQAVDHLEQALRAEAALPSPPLLARSQLWAARALVARGAPGDAERAATLRTAARETAAALGMAALAAHTEADTGAAE